MKSKAVTANAPTQSLPFTLSVTEIPFDNPPAYMGPENPVDLDYPFCPVLIDDEYWIIYKNGYRDPVFRFKGTNLENAQRQPDGFARLPGGAHYMLGGMWYDASEKKLYAPLHCETNRHDDPPHGGAGQVERQVHLATSTDKGLTWHYEGALITRDDPHGPLRKPLEFSGLYWDGSDGDHHIYVDTRGGYVYLYTNHYLWPKTAACAPGAGAGSILAYHRVARCAIGDKMAPGKWRRFYNGAWSEPGLGGKASYVNAQVATYNTYLRKYISFNLFSGLSVCSDLEKQDWTPSVPFKEEAWGIEEYWATWVTDAAKRDLFTSGRELFLYSFWWYNKARLFRIELGRGETPMDGGYLPFGRCYAKPPYQISMDPMNTFAREPLYESNDPVESRRTRTVRCTSPEVTYEGLWITENVREHNYKGEPVKLGQTADCSLQFSFKGKDIYWRAFKGQNSGKADVYLDDVFQKTVDCYAAPSTGDQFAFVGSGLDPDVTHTIKIVVRGDKNVKSRGPAIRHMAFEYAAESYRASDGFSCIMGKNNWHYQQRNGSACTDMEFNDPNWVGDGKCVISYFFQVPDAGCDAVRKWVAPHDGNIRVEGEVSNAAQPGDGVAARISHNSAEVWPARPVQDGKPAPHDLKLTVKKGDALSFCVSQSGSPGTEVRVTWDPVITFVR